MGILEEIKERQAELHRMLEWLEEGELANRDEIAAAQVKRQARHAISSYEKIVHLLNREQVGHA